MKNRGCLFWLVVGGGGLALLLVVLFAVMMVGFFNSQASKTAEAAVVRHPDLAGFVGSPVRIDWWRGGSISTNDTLGAATFNLTAVGPRGEANVRVLLVRPEGATEWEAFYAAIADGQGRSSMRLDLRGTPAKSRLAEGLRESAVELPGAGALDVKLDGEKVTLVRWAR